MVGSRRATGYGTRTAEALAAEAVRRGAVVVSGLAQGIDRAAHRGALSGGPSVAVVAGGLDLARSGPKRALYERLLAEGTLVSEQGPGLAPVPRLFPVRNRIITGMSAVTVVVEAACRSGSLISARLAAEQGREVFAVPGNLDSKVSEGTNRLIADGARPFLATDEVFEALGLEPPETSAAGAAGVGGVPVERPEERLVFGLLGDGPAALDELVLRSRLDGARVLELLTALEIGGLAERTPGGLFRAVPTLKRSRGD